jgi:hypothetical protein
MALWFRVIEVEEGVFACRFGLTEYDRHDTASAAIDHLKTIAADHSPAQVYLHPRDGVTHLVAEM